METVNNVSKGSKIQNVILKIPFFFAVTIAAIILDLIYVPLRYLARLIAKFVLRAKYRTHDDMLNDRNPQGIIKFFRYITNFHPYDGNNKFLMYLEKHVVGETKHAQNNRIFIYFLLPTLTTFIVFVIIPFFMGIFYSFTDYNFLSSSFNMVGFANYAKIFTDYNFIYSFFRTAQYTIISVILINLVSFFLALLVTQKLKLTNVYRAGFFMPNLIGGLVLGYIWKFIYNAALPSIVESVFTPTLLSQADKAMGALITVVIWQYAGYIMMIYIAALQNVPQDLVEASMIDGANFFQRLRTIIFPLVAQAFTVSLFLTLVTSFKQFDTVFALTNGAPSGILPGFLQSWLGETARSIKVLNLLALDIYTTGNVENKMALAQAKAVVFFAFLMIVSVIQVTYNKRREVEL